MNFKKTWLLSMLLCCGLFMPVRAEERPTQDKPADMAKTQAKDAGFGEMTTYYMGFLVKGPKWAPGTSPELEQLQKDHLAHIRKMAESKKLVIAGPFLDGGHIRGILIFKTETLEEAKAMAEEDPAVKAGRLAVELHPWMVQKGILP